jgi:hypothetical protein
MERRLPCLATHVPPHGGRSGEALYRAAIGSVSTTSSSSVLTINITEPATIRW